MLRVYILRVLPIIYGMLIWLQSSRFNPESVHIFTDYVSYRLIIFIGIVFELAHLIEFGILYFLLTLAFQTYGDLTEKKEMFAMGVAIIYGLVDEIHQSFTLFRSFSIVDIIKNTIGVIVIWWAVRKVYKKEKPSRFGMLLKRITSSSDEISK